MTMPHGYIDPERVVIFTKPLAGKPRLLVLMGGTTDYQLRELTADESDFIRRTLPAVAKAVAALEEVPA